MLKEHNIEEILPRTHKLFDKYLHKAYNYNPLIKDLIADYRIAPQLPRNSETNATRLVEATSSQALQISNFIVNNLTISLIL